MRASVLCAMALLAGAPQWAPAEVADSGPNGFTVKIEVNVKAPPQEVYHRFIHNVGDWWSPGHTFSHNSHNLFIEEKAMGCFCERLAKEGSVRHMEVIHLAPGKTVILSGALGPLSPLAATGTLDLEFSAAGSGTKLDVIYSVAGYLPRGMDSFAAPVDGVLTQQFSRLKNYVEHGTPAAKK